MQYQGVQGAAAFTWVTAFALAHGPLGTGEIVANEGNGHVLTALFPPHEEGCLSQLALEYHFECTDQERFTELSDGVRAAIYYGTDPPYSEAACDSSFQ